MKIMLHTLVLRLYDVHSLKDKRTIVKGIVESARHKLQISVAEVDEQDTHNLAVLAAVAVGTDPQPLQQLADSLERMAVQAGAEPVESRVEWL